MKTLDPSVVDVNIEPPAEIRIAAGPWGNPAATSTVAIQVVVFVPTETAAGLPAIVTEGVEVGVSRVNRNETVSPRKPNPCLCDDELIDTLIAWGSGESERDSK